MKGAGNQQGVLLVNLGSPASPRLSDVRAFLGEFLMDPYVLDMPWLLRKVLVSGVILRTRPKQTAKAYRSIWTTQGSPLLLTTARLTQAVTDCLALPTAYAMRYGKPSIESAMRSLSTQGVRTLLIAPLYPQYAMSTTYTSLQCAILVNKQLPSPMQLKALPPFYQNDSYIECLAASIRPHLADADQVLFSYHGLPERHLRRTDPSGQHCLANQGCCENQAKAHETCYLHQAKVTSHKVAKCLGLTQTDWQTSFQSRLGRAAWLRPYTDQILTTLPKQKICKLAVCCPGFVADNLETLEEIDIRGRDLFLQAGGTNYTYVPCLNDTKEWTQVLAQLCLQALHQSTVL